MTRIHSRRIKKLQARRGGYDKLSVEDRNGRTRPGSMNPKKQA